MAWSDATISYLDVHEPDATTNSAAFATTHSLTALTGDGSTNDRQEIQRYLNLIQSGAANHAVHLMFGNGKRYKIDSTLHIHKGHGARLTGGGHIGPGARDSTNDVYNTQFFMDLGSDPILNFDAAISFTGASYVHTGGAAERLVTSSNAFAGYAWASGDRIWLTTDPPNDTYSPYGLVTGSYEIASKVDADSISLVADTTRLTGDESYVRTITKLPILQITNHQGLVMDGFSFHGNNQSGVDGVQCVTNSKDGINGSRHHYVNCNWVGCETAWSHDADNGLGSSNHNGDSYLFNNCDFYGYHYYDQDRIGIYINNVFDLHSEISHCRFHRLKDAIKVGDGSDTDAHGGNLNIHHITLNHVHNFITTYGSGSGDRGITVNSVKVDSGRSNIRPIMYTEGAIGGSGEGRGNGPITFSNVIVEDNAQCHGTIYEIETYGSPAKCRLKLLYASGGHEGDHTILAGDVIHCEATGVETYDSTDDAVIEFTAQSDSTDDGTYLLVETDVSFAGNHTGGSPVWYHATPLFRLRGGSSLVVQDSVFYPDTTRRGTMVRARNGSYTSGRASMITIQRCQAMSRPTTSAVGAEEYALLTLDDDEDTGTVPFFNIDSCLPTAGWVAPWSQKNYGTAGIYGGSSGMSGGLT